MSIEQDPTVCNASYGTLVVYVLCLVCLVYAKYLCYAHTLHPICMYWM